MRLAVVAGAIHAHADDPFIPAWGDMLGALARRANVRLYALRYPAAGPPHRLFGAEVVRLGWGGARLRRSPPLWRAAVASLAADHRRTPFDAVLAWQASEPGLVAAWGARRIRRPLLVHVAGGELACHADIGFGAWCQARERMAVRWALRRADVITCGADDGRSRLARRLPRRAARAVVAPLGLDLSAFERLAPAPLQPGARARLLSVADFRPVKDHGCLLEAVGRVAAVRPVALDLVGDGPLAARVVGEWRRRGLAADGRCWGRVPPAVRHLAFARAHAFVHASRHEAQGMALIEAAAAGLPIATTDVGVAPSLPGARFTAPPGDPAALAEAIHAALDAAARPLDARAAARQAVIAAYNADAAAERWLALVAKAVARRARR